MAEYITKDEILWRMTNGMNEQDVYLPTQFKEIVIDECNVENVVERSKIDKAIKEIKSKKYIIDIDRALEIFKRNIGE